MIPQAAKLFLATRLESRDRLLGSRYPPGKPTTSDYALAYNTTTFPVQGLSPPTSTNPESKANLDIKHYHPQLSDPSPLNPPNGTSCTVIEVPPGSEVPMHRTATLDYGVIIDGTTELVLDSGEKRIMAKGDVFIQRGTAHAWRNTTGKRDNSGILRVFFVFQPVEQVRLEDGKVVSQDLNLSLRET